MTTTYKIVNLERSLPDETVTTAHWTAAQQDGEFSASAYGSVGFTRDETSADFIPFEALTEEIVLGWVKASMDTEALEASLQAQINAQKTPTSASGTPWNTPVVSE